MEFHEIANLFPMMQPDELSDLVDDIKQNGLIEPIVLYEDKILDGRNRYLACGEAGVKPHYEYYKGNEPVGYVISKNVQRRHLNGSQKAMIALEVKDIFEREAKKRQGTRTDLNIPELIPESDKGEARDKAGKAVGVSGRYVSDAEKIKREAPEYVKPILNGDITITKAKREIRRKDRIESTPVIPDGKYNVIYADPPWKYEFGFDIHGAADRHYHTMTIQELCDLPISELVEDNAVLFLWTTSPKLFDSIDIIKAWGFDYKTSFVWDKKKHVMGHYNSVRHEFLLLCVKGSFPKQSNTLHDSVISIERSDKHSEKPEYFRELIEQMYPKSKKIELFARKQIDGWDTWGNEL
jgi:N6-adenosine-specific RNA methylase IME4